MIHCLAQKTLLRRDFLLLVYLMNLVLCNFEGNKEILMKCFVCLLVLFCFVFLSSLRVKLLFRRWLLCLTKLTLEIK